MNTHGRTFVPLSPTPEPVRPPHELSAEITTSRMFQGTMQERTTIELKFFANGVGHTCFSLAPGEAKNLGEALIRECAGVAV